MKQEIWETHNQSEWANNKVKARKMLNHKKYYVNFDYKYFSGLTRKQVAFLFLIEKLNKTNFTATNKEIEAAIDIRFDGVHDLYKNINRKFPGLIKISYQKVNRFGKVVESNKDYYSKQRNITLTRPLHIKGVAYINLPSFATNKRSCFLSSNELKVLAYLKSMPKCSFNGYLRVILSKLDISYGILRRALLKLEKVKAIFRQAIKLKQKIKNVFYTINSINVNQDWTYFFNKNDNIKKIKKKIPDESDSEEWDKLLESIGGSI